MGDAVWLARGHPGRGLSDDDSAGSHDHDEVDPENAAGVFPGPAVLHGYGHWRGEVEEIAGCMLPSDTSWEDRELIFIQ